MTDWASPVTFLSPPPNAVSFHGFDMTAGDADTDLAWLGQQTQNESKIEKKQSTKSNNNKKQNKEQMGDAKQHHVVNKRFRMMRQRDERAN